MEPLCRDASLGDLQEYVIKMEVERGLADLDVGSQCLKLGEELGEVYAEAERFNGHDTTALAGELTDALILTLSIANRCSVNLSAGFHERTGLQAPTLGDIQTYAAATGHANDGLFRLCLHVGEQAGDINRAIRKLHGHPTDPHGRHVTPSQKCLDLITALAAIAHYLDVSLEDAFRAKELINNTRVWR